MSNLVEVVAKRKAPGPIRYVVDLSYVSCPACGSADRWDRIEAAEPEANNPELRAFCDCGSGEVVVVIE